MTDAARLARIEAALGRGDAAGAIDDACALVDEHPDWPPAQRAYVSVLRAWARGQRGLVARAFPTRAPHATPRVSAIVCSIDRAKFDAVSASFAARFTGLPFELVGVHDARSLAEAYDRGASRATGEVLVFAHDDIELVTSDFAPRLLAHLETHDGVGVAGASRVTGPRWDHAGQRHMHGAVLHPAPPGRGGVLLMAAGFQAPVCEAVKLLDGVLVAVHRRVWEAHRFDAQRYDGFHFYDLDFTRRASAAGARLAVPLDLVLLHRSTGRYGGDWRRYAEVFAAQVGVDAHAPRAPGGLQVRLDSLDEVDAMRAALLHFRYGAARG